MIGNRVRELREAMHISQAQLARRLGVRRATLSALETGKSGRVDLRVLDHLCRIMHCQPGELLYYRSGKRR